MGETSPNRSKSLDIWGPYPNYDDIAKLEYGRILWKSRLGKSRLLAHWTNPTHPHNGRFRNNRTLVEEIFNSQLSDEDLDFSLRKRSVSLRAAAREIPSVFGSLSP
jgi:hypothetical protein